MPATPISMEITDCEAARKDGVFTAKITYTLQVTISSDPLDMLPEMVAGLFDLPIEGTAYPNTAWPYVSCRGVSCNREEGGVYTYETDWSDQNSTKDKKAVETDPLDDPPIVKPVAGMKDRAITKDRDNKAILNKAGDPIIQTIDDNTIGLSVTCNVADDDAIKLLILSMRNSTNVAPFQIDGWKIGTNLARFIVSGEPLSELKTRNEINYKEFKFELLIDERDKHYGVPLNAGFRKKVVVSLSPYKEEKRTILSDDGSEPSEPVPLKTDGDVLANPDPDNVNYLEVKKYFERDYTLLPGCSSWTPPP